MPNYIPSTILFHLTHYILYVSLYSVHLPLTQSLIATMTLCIYTPHFTHRMAHFHPFHKLCICLMMMLVVHAFPSSSTSACKHQLKEAINMAKKDFQHSKPSKTFQKDYNMLSNSSKRLPWKTEVVEGKKGLPLCRNVSIFYPYPSTLLVFLLTTFCMILRAGH